MIDPVALSPPQTVTFEEYLKLYDGKHAEWHPDGTVEIVVSNNIFHIRMVTFLTMLLNFYFEFRPIGQVIQAAFAQKIPGQSSREPDIMLIMNDHYDRIKYNYLDGPADIAIEVVSPESVARDYRDKLREYAQGGVKEYWLIDLERHTVDIHELDAKGVYQRRLMDAEGRISSSLLTDFVLNPEILWSDSLPVGTQVLNLVAQMLDVTVTINPKNSP